MIPKHGIYVQGLFYANNRNDCEPKEKSFGRYPVSKFYRAVRNALTIKLTNKESEVHVYRSGKDVLIYAVNGNGDLEVSIQIDGEWTNVLRSRFIRHILKPKLHGEVEREKVATAIG